MPTDRQLEIAEFVSRYLEEHGRPPSQREIADAFGFRSTNAVRSHLRLLENKGLLEWTHGRARGLRVKSTPRLPGSRSLGIPILGRIAAGKPVDIFSLTDDFLPVDPAAFPGHSLFALRVTGSSMTGVGILPDDFAIVQAQEDVADGEIAAVIIDETATLKKIFRQGNALVLRAENPEFADIVLRNGDCASVSIAGKYVGLIRTCQ